MKNSRVRRSLIFVLLFLAFLVLMDYPFVARLVNNRIQGEVALDYNENTESLTDTVQDRELARAAEYNTDLASGTGTKIEDAFEEKDQEQQEEHQNYESLLNTNGDGVMGTVEIPKIHLNLPIYHGTSERVLEDGAGHLEGSSLPVGGTDTHCCISAHRGLVQKKMFTELDELEKDDIFLIHVLGETLCYRVSKIQTVMPDEVKSLEIQRGKDLVTLITCTPYGINTHRLYVEGCRIPYTEEVTQEVQEQDGFRWQEWWWVYLSILLIGLMCLLLVRYNRTAKKSEK